MRPSSLALLLCVAAACDGWRVGGDGTDGAPPDGAANQEDAAAADAALADAASLDAPASDAAAPDAAPPDGSTGPVDYLTLSQTGLYADISTKQLAPGVVEFEPAYKLWSDGAAKTRWILLPPGESIDTSDMDHWRFPVGTKVWKEFRHEDENGIRLETRLIEIIDPVNSDAGPGESVWVGSFVWRSDESDADFAELGATDVRGTAHDVPTIYDCDRCHGGEPGRLLGFSAVQLSHGGPGPTLTSLADSGALSDPPPQGVTYPVPGDATESAALGTLHANCGHCHQPDLAPVTTCYDLTGLDLRVMVDQDTVLATGAYLTAVDQPLSYWITPNLGNDQGLTLRIDSGSPETSAVHYRMSVREALGDGADKQMPPIFTDAVDPAGASAVETWIQSL